ncbi:MAG: chromosome segregation protein SMC [Ignavibacteriaceae bacterium]|nr:chromosome segregation protein SMC [Ignavibacteriaceae bacterium]
MYLSKLEIIGFKSFAQKTPINFHQGVTSIVGPNGCGKTNIVDAIRWCLGEQRTSTLRSDKMENVIFNGTSTRKPMGMAEVSLTIENTKGILPIEYTDVTITRRIFRSGESEYLLNKNICRLKDITNLFMDTGIGANAYSVIELKMVETILSSKAEERRTMFEEAAGVNKYKLRRRLALRKLEEVMSDLTRVNDIVSEVAKNVASLERQAKKADRYNQLSSGLKEIELELAEREYAWFLDKTEEIILSKVENNKRKKQYEDEMSSLLEKLDGNRRKIGNNESELRAKRIEVSKLTENIYLLKSDISVSKERQKSVSSNIAKYENEITEFNNQLESTKKTIEQALITTTVITNEIDKNREIKDDLKVKIENATQLLDGKRAEVKKHSEIIVAGLKQVSDKENELLNITRSVEERNNQINKLNSRILNLTSDVAKTVGFIESLKEEKENVSSKLNEAEDNYARKVEEKEKLEQELNDFKTREHELNSILNSLNDKISFIQNLVDNLEGVSLGTKSLLELTGWANGKVILLANAGNSSDDLRPAVEAALRNNVNDILISSVEELKKGIEHLKNNNLGRASFYLNPNGDSRTGLIEKLQKYFSSRQRKKIEAHSAFKSWASSAVQAEGNWENFFNKLLNNTAIVNDLDSAILLSQKFSDFRFVTLDGDLAEGTGLIESGSPVADESLFGKRQLLLEIKKEIPLKQNELNELSKKISEYETSISKIDLKVLSDQGRMLVNDLANIDKQISQFEYEKKKANDETEKTHHLIKDVAAESNKLDNDKILIGEQLSELQKQKSLAESQLQTLEDENKNAEVHFNQLIAEKNEIKVGLERKLGEARNLQNTITRSEENIQNINNSIISRKDDIEFARKEVSEIDNQIEKHESEVGELENAKKYSVEELEKVEKDYELLKSEGSSIEAAINEIRTEKDSILDANRDLEIKLTEYEIKKNGLIEHINEEYSLKIERKKFDDNESFDFETHKAEVHDLRQKIRNLGPINLLAYSEFEEERDRLEFLNKQRDDLVESEKDIVKTIEEINLTAQSKFAETFNQIRENFIRVFRSLFDPGDEADLRLEEGADPLEGKIEIIAKPKGKRPTSIELLSGGEKTLTAIALLFAIYLVKPSPFCILDEIDAPLDDANIDRFTRLIKEFSLNTQFIVVTHNKRTMEAAETLYGVTMQEEGVSKLVSVHFNEDIKVVA